MSMLVTKKARVENIPDRVTRLDGRCVYRGCRLFGGAWRTTRQGSFLISYCTGHERLAADTFGEEETR